MAFHQSAEAITHFQRWLDRLARPIEFASRDAFAHLPTVKNLSSFMSLQVLGALSDRVYPKSVEAALLKLRALFVEDEGRLTTNEQQRRLLEAAAIVKSLRDAAHDQRQVEQPEPLETSDYEDPRESLRVTSVICRSDLPKVSARSAARSWNGWGSKP